MIVPVAIVSLFVGVLLGLGMAWMIIRAELEQVRAGDFEAESLGGADEGGRVHTPEITDVIG